MTIRWKAAPEEHDYPAALSYLSLHFREEVAQEYVEQLKVAPVVQFHAKDIFRASGLIELPATNHHVKKTLKKINDGEKLSPLLLVRSNKRVIVADGYHRLCGVRNYDEDEMIPCQIV